MSSKRAPDRHPAAPKEILHERSAAGLLLCPRKYRRLRESQTSHQLRMLGGKQERGQSAVGMANQMHRSEVKFFDQHRQVICIDLGRIGWRGASSVAIGEIVT